MSYLSSSSESSNAQERLDAVLDSIRELEKSCNFLYVGELGKGTYGDVLKMYDANADTYKAAKVIIPKNICENEMLVWSKLNHKNIIAAEEVMILRDGPVIVIMPLQFSTMCELISDKRFSTHPKSVDFVKRWLYEVLDGLNYMHNSNVCHLDMKLDNVLISHNGIAMICDFSFAYDTRSTLTKDKVGVPDLYRPPELFKSKMNLCGKGIDLWCYGVMVVEAFTGDCLLDRVVSCRSWQRDVRPLLELVLYPAVFGALVSHHFPNCSFWPSDLDDVLDYMDGFLRIKVENRVSSAEALSHPFICQGEFIEVNLQEIYLAEELDEESFFTSEERPDDGKSGKLKKRVYHPLVSRPSPKSKPHDAKVDKATNVDSSVFAQPIKVKNDRNISQKIQQCSRTASIVQDEQLNNLTSRDTSSQTFLTHDIPPTHVNGKLTGRKANYMDDTYQKRGSDQHDGQTIATWVRSKWNGIKKWFGWKKSPSR